MFVMPMVTPAGFTVRWSGKQAFLSNGIQGGMMVKKKISRKQLLKEPDEFFTFSGRLIQSAAKYRNHLTVAIGLVVAAFLIFSLIAFFLDKAERKAFVMLNQANEKYNSALEKNRNPKQALEAVEQDFQIILDEYGGYRGGEIARVRFANISLEGGDYQQAAELFAGALNDFEDDPSYRNLILNGLAYSHEAAGNFDKAAEYFNMIAVGDNPILKDMAWFNLGRVYEVLGKNHKQMEAFKKVVNEYPDSMYYKLAKDRSAG